MMLELRWMQREGTTTEPPILQYRSKDPGAWGIGEWSAWRKVPLVVVSKEEFATHTNARSQGTTK